MECWRRQTWPTLELLVLDDLECPAFPAEASKASTFFPENGWESVEMAALRAKAGPEWLRRADWPDTRALDAEGATGREIAYFCLPRRLTIGAKRNLACALASGEFICHLDSDDWSADGRIADQMKRLLSSGMDVTGYHSMLFTDSSRWWRCDGPKFDNQMGAFGTSLLYRKSWWKAHPFVDGPKDHANYEDKPFVLQAMRAGRFIGAPGGDLMFARIHADNTSPKGPSSSIYKPVVRPMIEAFL